MHWVLRKTQILKNSAQESIASSTTDNQNPRQIEKNMMKNFENLEKGQFMVDHHDNQLSEEISKNGEESQPHLEKEFDQIFSRLKIAQANVTKSFTELKHAGASAIAAKRAK